MNMNRSGDLSGYHKEEEEEERAVTAMYVFV